MPITLKNALTRASVLGPKIPSTVNLPRAFWIFLTSDPRSPRRTRLEDFGAGFGAGLEGFDFTGFLPRNFKIPSACSRPTFLTQEESFILAASDLVSIKPFSVRTAGIAVSRNTWKFARFLPRSFRPQPAAMVLCRTSWNCFVLLDTLPL